MLCKENSFELELETNDFRIYFTWENFQFAEINRVWNMYVIKFRLKLSDLNLLSNTDIEKMQIIDEAFAENTLKCK